MSAFRVAVASLSVAMFAGPMALSARAYEYHVKAAPITAKGEHHVLTIGELIVTCKKAELKYSGTFGYFKGIALAPAWSECSALGSPVVLKSEKASFELLTPTLVPHTEREFSLPVSLTGASGAKIVMSTTLEGEHCEATIPLQGFAHEATRFLDNIGETGGELRLELTQISFSSNKCGGLLPSEGNSADYEGYASESGLLVVP